MYGDVRQSERLNFPNIIFQWAGGHAQRSK